jgi:DNA invertase Pin-like site-specific DNA recombinase
MTPKEMYKQIKLRYSFSIFSNLSDAERKIYRTGFRTGYRLARQFFKSNKRSKKVVNHIAINDVVVPENVKDILAIIANQLNVNVNDITARTRIQQAVIARSIFINVLRDKYNMPFTKIAVLLGNRDHTTMIHHVRMKINKEHYWQPNYIIWNRYQYVMDNVK